jgi:Domain of unknown function (DUF1996)
MRRWLVIAALTLGVTATATAALAGTGTTERSRAELHRGGGALYFAILCGFSHRNQDDPIVFFGQRNRSHDHTYFGNTSTDAFSTPASLRAAGQTTCRARGDTAAYWAPTLFADGNAVQPRYLVAYYVRRTLEPVEPFPAGLKVIAGSAAARSAQGEQVTSWSCGGRNRSSAIPTCFSGRRSALRLQVNFPNCWDGRNLDSANHQSHMAYSSDGRCPAAHPVEVPALTMLIQYGVSGGSGFELASGGQFSAHADFVNAWNQATLTALVNRYLNRSRRL